MNTGFHHHPATPSEVFLTRPHFHELFKRTNTLGLPQRSDRKSKPEVSFSQMKVEQKSNDSRHFGIVNRAIDVKNKSNEKLSSKTFLLKKIDKILLKNESSNLKSLERRSNMNTSIELGDFFTISTQPSNKEYRNGKNYQPIITQNDEQAKQNCIISRNTNQKLEICKLRTAITKHDVFKMINSMKRVKNQQSEVSETISKTENITPSNNQWEKSLNLLRLEKIQNEKSSKHCRIMIRRINTDLLFTKRTESHTKLKSRKIYNLSEFKVSNPIRSVMSEGTTVKLPQTSGKSIIPEEEGIELNPWSTTEIKQRQELEQAHPF